MGHCPAWCLVHLPLKELPTCLLTGPNTKHTSTHAEPSLYTQTIQNLPSISGDLMQQINPKSITFSCGCISQDVLFVSVGNVIW